jgi:hypothetical protein
VCRALRKFVLSRFVFVLLGTGLKTCVVLRGVLGVMGLGPWEDTLGFDDFSTEGLHEVGIVFVTIS